MQLLILWLLFGSCPRPSQSQERRLLLELLFWVWGKNTFKKKALDWVEEDGKQWVVPLMLLFLLASNFKHLLCIFNSS